MQKQLVFSLSLLQWPTTAVVIKARYVRSTRPQGRPGHSRRHNSSRRAAEKALFTCCDFHLGLPFSSFTFVCLFVCLFVYIPRGYVVFLARLYHITYLCNSVPSVSSKTWYTNERESVITLSAPSALLPFTSPPSEISEKWSNLHWRTNRKIYISNKKTLDLESRILNLGVADNMCLRFWMSWIVWGMWFDI